ncbi:MAG: DsbA family oxidoreductase [Alphaproteobacteria bacterium]|nr:DsbA family oxidoreductase [Alphaproteobacteria bacterium]
MQIDVISDPVCPWCYIGKRRLERAVRLRPHISFEIRWRPFQLDPTTPPEGYDRKTYIEKKFGSSERVKPIQTALLQAGESEGITFAFDKITRTPNTINAHRLIRWAHSLGVQDEIVEGLFRGYFVDGLDIGQIKILAQIGDDAGMDGELVEELLSSDTDIESVEQQDSMARKFGVQGVPSFFMGGKTLITGAEDAETLAQIIDRAISDAESAVATG